MMSLERRIVEKIRRLETDRAPWPEIVAALREMEIAVRARHRAARSDTEYHPRARACALGQIQR